MIGLKESAISHDYQAQMESAGQQFKQINYLPLISPMRKVPWRSVSFITQHIHLSPCQSLDRLY